jgi:hypothetical protein
MGRVEDGWVWRRLLRQLGGRAKVPPATRRLLKQALHDAAFAGACLSRVHACEVLRRAQTYEDPAGWSAIQTLSDAVCETTVADLLDGRQSPTDAEGCLTAPAD